MSVTEGSRLSNPDTLAQTASRTTSVKIIAASAGRSYRLLTPMIGSPIMLDDQQQRFCRWWEDLAQPPANRTPGALSAMRGLGEINFSSILPIPDEASAEIARRVVDRLRSSAEWSDEPR
jgi:hypothetical protein